MLNNNYLKEWIFSILLGIIFTSVFTYPYILNLNNNYLAGKDFLLNSWTYWYSSYSIMNGDFFNLTVFFNTSQLYPFPGVGTHLDFVILPSLIIYTPLFLTLKNHILALNLTLFISYILNFVVCYICINSLLKKRYASIIGAIIFSFAPGVINLYTGHTEYSHRFLIPVFFLIYYKFTRTPNFKLGFTLFTIYVLSWFTNIQIAIFTSILAPIIFIITCFYQINLNVYNHKKTLSILKYCLFFGIIYFPILIYFFNPYLSYSKKETFSRSITEAQYFSAEPVDFFVPNSTNMLFGNIALKFESQRIKDGENNVNYAEHTLTPGLFIILLILFFVIQKFVSKDIINTKQDNNVFWFVCFSGLITSVVLSFGPYIIIQNHTFKLPYFYLYHTIPILQAIRTPTRIQYIWLFFIAYIVSSGISDLSKKISKQNLKFFEVLLLFLITAGYLNVNYLSKYPYKKIDFDFNNKVVLFLPIRSGYDVDGSKYFIQQIDNPFRSINGSTGSEHQLHGYNELIETLKSDTYSDYWFEILQTLSVSYIAVNKISSLSTKELVDKTHSLQDLIVYEDASWIILDVSKTQKKTPVCKDKNFYSLNPQIWVYYSSTNQVFYLHYLLENKLNCNMPFIYNDRYIRIKYKSVSSLFTHTAYIKLPPYILSNSTIEDNLEISKNKYINFDKIKLELGENNNMQILEVQKIP